jgi:hypothetical protein
MDPGNTRSPDIPSASTSHPSGSAARLLRKTLAAIDLRAWLRWLYTHRLIVGSIWLIVGLGLTAIVLSSIWYVGGSPATSGGFHESPLGRYPTPASPAVPGLGHLLITRWWGWLGLLVFVPVFTVTSPLLLIGAPMFVLGLAIALALLPLLAGVLLVVAPLGMVANVPRKALNTLLEMIGLREHIEEMGKKLRLSLGLSREPRRSAEGRAVRMDATDFAAFENRLRPPRSAPVLIGRFAGKAFRCFTDKHILIVAPTRAGKGRDLILGNLRLYPGSVFVLDPKGENATTTAGERTRFGEVHVLDPFGTTRIPSSGWNPLTLLRDEQERIPAAQMLADALIVGDGSDHWSSSARQLVTGLLLHVATAPDLPTRDLPTVYDLMMTDLSGTLKAMTTSDEPAGVVRRTGTWGLACDAKEWSSIVSTAAVQLQWLNAPQIAAVLREDAPQVDFTRYLTGVQSVFVCLPAPYFETYNRWLRMLTAAAIDTMTRRLKPPPQPVRFVLDELAQLGHLQKVETALTLTAGYGVQLWGIWQHLGDIARCYPRAGIAGWVSCSGARLVFGAVDNMTVDYFSHATAGAMAPADILQIAPTDLLAMIDGQNPAIVQRISFDTLRVKPTT